MSTITPADLSKSIITKTPVNYAIMLKNDILTQIKKSDVNDIKDLPIKFNSGILNKLTQEDKDIIGDEKTNELKRLLKDIYNGKSIKEIPKLYDIKGLYKYNKSGFNHIIGSLTILIILVLILIFIMPKTHSYIAFNNAYDQFLSKNKEVRDNDIIKNISKYKHAMYNTLQKYIITTPEYKSGKNGENNKYTTQVRSRHGLYYYKIDDSKIEKEKDILLDKMSYENLQHGVTPTQLFIYKNKTLIPSYAFDNFLKFIVVVSGIWLIFSIYNFKNINSNNYNSPSTSNSWISSNNSSTSNNGIFQNYFYYSMIGDLFQGVGNMVSAVIM